MRSLTARLSRVILALVLLAILLGLVCLETLRHLDGLSSSVQQGWTPSWRALADLERLTSQFRAAEAGALLARDSSEFASQEKQLTDLEREISTAQREYAQGPHAPGEQPLYTHFVAQWVLYCNIVHAEQSLSEVARRGNASQLYDTSSQTAYGTASGALRALIDRHIAASRETAARRDTAYENARWLIALTTALAVLLVIAAMMYVSRSLFTPLREMAAHMHQLATNDALQADATSRSDELGEMADAMVLLREKVAAVGNHRRDLDRHAAALKNFISMTAHELRSPLTVIDAHAQRLIRLKDCLRPDDLSDRATRMRRAVLWMTHLVHQLVDHAHVLGEDIQLNFQPTCMDLRLVVHEVCELQRELAPRAQIEASVLIEPLLIIGDSKLLFQVFSNLLSNATKYSPHGGMIRVVVARDQTHAAVSIEDEGIGIPDKDHERVFQLYYRAANVAGIVGTGVGLYFAKAVTELHQGEISVASREGEGSRFTVRLPLRGPVRQRGALVSGGPVPR
jgi:two-component system, OmpR family, sensor kinase